MSLSLLQIRANVHVGSKSWSIVLSGFIRPNKIRSTRNYMFQLMSVIFWPPLIIKFPSCVFSRAPSSIGFSRTASSLGFIMSMHRKVDKTARGRLWEWMERRRIVCWTTLFTTFFIVRIHGNWRKRRSELSEKGNKCIRSCWKEEFFLQKRARRV